MPLTPRKHFDEGLGRAKTILEHARQVSASSAEEDLLRDDLLRRAWMFTVGAMDADAQFPSFLNQTGATQKRRLAL